MKTYKEIDSSKFPKRTYLAHWAYLLGVSVTTMINKQKRDGKLGKGVKAINGRRLYTKEEICRAFDIPLNGEK